MPRLLTPDVAILGGGPAGCNAASWLGQLGLTSLIVEREPRLCATLAGLDFAQDWVLGEPGQPLSALADRYAAQAAAAPGVTLRLGTLATAARPPRAPGPPPPGPPARRPRPPGPGTPAPAPSAPGARALAPRPRTPGS